MTNYYVQDSGPVLKNVKCVLDPAGPYQGLHLKIGTQHVLWVRPEGDFMLLPLDPSRAADTGLLLDEAGRVKCVS